MEVTVRDMDVTVEHTGMCLLRVTGMTVLKNGLFHTTLLMPLVLWIRRAGGISSVIMPPRFFGGENGRIFFTRRPE
jgi:hypothetical protein